MYPWQGVANIKQEPRSIVPQYNVRRDHVGSSRRDIYGDIIAEDDRNCYRSPGRISRGDLESDPLSFNNISVIENDSMQIPSDSGGNIYRVMPVNKLSMHHVSPSKKRGHFASEDPLEVQGEPVAEEMGNDEFITGLKEEFLYDEKSMMQSEDKTIVVERNGIAIKVCDVQAVLDSTEANKDRFITKTSRRYRRFRSALRQKRLAEAAAKQSDQISLGEQVAEPSHSEDTKPKILPQQESSSELAEERAKGGEDVTGHEKGESECKESVVASTRVVDENDNSTGNVAQVEVSIDDQNESKTSLNVEAAIKEPQVKRRRIMLGQVQKKAPVSIKAKRPCESVNKSFKFPKINVSTLTRQSSIPKKKKKKRALLDSPKNIAEATRDPVAEKTTQVSCENQLNTEVSEPEIRQSTEQEHEDNVESTVQTPEEEPSVAAEIEPHLVALKEEPPASDMSPELDEQDSSVSISVPGLPVKAEVKIEFEEFQADMAQQLLQERMEDYINSGPSSDEILSYPSVWDNTEDSVEATSSSEVHIPVTVLSADDSIGSQEDILSITPSLWMKTSKDVLHAENKTYKCSTCSKCFSTSSDLRKHKRIHTGERPFRCAHCNKCFNQSSNLRMHMKVHVGTKCYVCDMCNKGFLRSCELKAHVRIHTGEKPYQCKFCNKLFNQSSHLKTHERIHTSDKPFLCTICSTTFATADDLTKHEGVHRGERPYTCRFCKKAFSSSAQLRRHEAMHMAEKKFKCSECDKAFLRNNDLRNHFRTHTGERPFQCILCKKTFNRRSHLKLHGKVHMNEKPYMCIICHEVFTCSEELRKHDRIHGRKKPCICSFCDLEFESQQQLKKHKMTHTESTWFACNLCPKKFFRSSDLKIHDRVHTGEKPYVCATCGKTFARSDYLKAHERIHDDS